MSSKLALQLKLKKAANHIEKEYPATDIKAFRNEVINTYLASDTFRQCSDPNDRIHLLSLLDEMIDIMVDMEIRSSIPVISSPQPSTH